MALLELFLLVYLNIPIENMYGRDKMLRNRDRRGKDLIAQSTEEGVLRVCCRIVVCDFARGIITRGRILVRRRIIFKERMVKIAHLFSFFLFGSKFLGFSLVFIFITLNYWHGRRGNKSLHK